MLASNIQIVFLNVASYDLATPALNQKQTDANCDPTTDTLFTSLFAHAQLVWPKIELQ